MARPILLSLSLGQRSIQDGSAGANASPEVIMEGWGDGEVSGMEGRAARQKAASHRGCRHLSSI